MMKPEPSPLSSRSAPLRLPLDAAPLLSVVVDCEEGFDWLSPIHGTPYTLDAFAGLPRAVQRARQLGIRLTCVATHPVLQDDAAWSVLEQAATAGDAVLGIHMHPWTTPPYGEAPTLANSFQANLDPAQEAAKIATMVDAFRARTGQGPTLFKAGRSGFGPATAAALIGHGIEVDLSFMPGFTYARQGGPSFLRDLSDPFRFRTAAGELLEIPDTGGFLGAMRGWGPWLHPLTDAPALRPLRAPGVLSRLGLLNRVPLTPEGVPLHEAKALTTRLHADGQRVFQLSFHSTSLIAGGTSYVPDQAAVDRLLDWIDAFVGFFRSSLGGQVVTPIEIAAALDAQGASAR